jgi:hypothetical protein
MVQGRRPESDLPAEYVSPWHLLGRDLRAVLASLRLRLRELWRRNRQADLWRPGFWPDALAAWFWPLLLSLLLLALLLAALLPIGLPSRRAAPAGTPPSVPEAGAPEARELVKPPLEAEVGPQEEAKQDVAAPSSASPARAHPEQEPGGREQSEAPLPPPPPARDPLLVALEPDGPALLLLEARPLPALALLRLTVGPAYAQLPDGQRRQQALDWWSAGRSLGYEQLELRDRRGRLLARSALVGEGMVLLHPP